jgi:hypothetical protein
VAIEFNGGSHNREKQIASDMIKTEIFKECGLVLETINVGTNFDESIERIKSNFLYV